MDIINYMTINLSELFKNKKIEVFSLFLDWNSLPNASIQYDPKYKDKFTTAGKKLNHPTISICFAEFRKNLAEYKKNKTKTFKNIDKDFFEKKDEKREVERKSKFGKPNTSKVGYKMYRINLTILIEKYLESQGILLDKYQKRRLEFVLNNEAYRRSLVYLFDEENGVIGFIQNILCFLYTKSNKFWMVEQIRKEEANLKLESEEYTSAPVVNNVKMILCCRTIPFPDKRMVEIMKTYPKVLESLSKLLSEDSKKIPECLKITLLHFFIDQSIRKEISKAIPSYLNIIGDISNI